MEVMQNLYPELERDNVFVICNINCTFTHRNYSVCGHFSLLHVINAVEYTAVFVPIEFHALKT
jgi:hypothetical protein